MKTKTPRIIFAAGTSLAVLLTGCVSRTDYQYVDAPRTAVKFETPKAQQTFYDAVLAKYIPDDGLKNGVSFGPLLPYSRANVTFMSSNIVFNDAVAVADANHDGTITEAEAEAYSTAVAARDAHQKSDDALSIRMMRTTGF